MNVNIGEDQHIQLADHPEFVRFQISDINHINPPKV